MFPSGPPKSGSLGSGVLVGVEVVMAVEVGVSVDVDGTVAVEVVAGVGVDATIEVEVNTFLGRGVEEGGGGKYTNVLVGLGKTRAVFVADAMVVGGAVCVVTNVTAVGVVKDVPAVVGSCVTVENEAPGVSKSLIHAGFVRMAGSTGSMNPLGLLVRKSLFGSSMDSTLASSSQLGEKRSAHLPASRRNKSPNRRMRAMMAQSRLSFSIAFIGKSI